MSYSLNSVISSLIATAAGTSKARVVEFMSKDMLVDLAANVYPLQRNHDKSAARKNFLGSMLWGDQLTFSAVYVKDLQKVWLIDGYNRVTRLASPGGSEMPEGKSAIVITHIVESFDKANELYVMFNSLEAAKRSYDFFESGLRSVGLLYLITSNLVCKGGRATGVQLAYGKRGSRYTTEATVAMAKGIQFVDSLRLNKTREIGGQLGAYFAIAQYAPNADLAENFIRDCNAAAFSRKTWTERDALVKAFRHFVDTKIVGGTGSKPNDKVFGVALGYFLAYCLASTKPVPPALIATILTTESDAEGIPLGSFVDAMTKLTRAL